MSNATKKILENLRMYNASPETVETLWLALLNEVRDDIDIIDANNPFIYLGGMSAVNTTAHIHESRALARKRYAKLAQTDADLYHHLSDKDRIGRWALPATVEAITVRLPYLEIINLARKNPTDNADLLRYIKFPRDTQFTVGGYQLGIHYPITINVLPNRGIQVMYDESVVSPLETLTTNVVTHRVVSISGVLYIDIDVPCHQFDITSDTYALSPMASFSKTILFPNKYYATRAYRKVNSAWVEMAITHSFDVYDINVPTLVIEVVENRVICRLPDVYASSNAVSDEIRIDVYTTKGAVTLDLLDFAPVDFSANWRNLDTLDDNYYSVPMDGFTQILLFSVSTITGGRDPIEFNQLRDKVIYRINDAEAPVTPMQLVKGMEFKGYHLQRYVDNLTDRVYVASKSVPVRDRDNLKTATIASNAMVVFTDTDATYSKSVIKHPAKNRTTVKANAMCSYEGGRLNLVPNSQVVDWVARSMNDQVSLVDSLKDKELYYLPYYYLIDYTTKTLKTRVYQLDTPKVSGRSFIARNLAVPMSVVTSASSIEMIKDAYGFASNYLLTVVATFPKGYLTSHENAGIQLSLTHFDSSSQTVITLPGVAGDITASTISHTFQLDTSFDINGQHEIQISTLGDNYLPLQSTFGLNYTINDLENPDTTILITEETISLQLGELLEGLYAPCRVIIGSPEYALHEVDVPAVWDSDQYVFEDFGPVLIENEDGSLDLEILALEGSPITLGDPPVPVIAYHAGEKVVAPGGGYVIDKPASVEYHVGFTLIDGRYRLANTVGAKAYTKAMAAAIINYLKGDILPMGKRLEGRTALFYKPKGALGKSKVAVGAGIEVMMDTRLDWVVTYHLTARAYNDSDTLKSLTRGAKSIISEVIEGTTISITAVTDKLKVLLPTQDLIGVDVEPFGENKDYTVITLTDTGASFGVRDELVVLADGSIEVEPAVSIRYINHQL